MRKLRPFGVVLFLLASFVAPTSAQQDVEMLGVGDRVVVNGYYVGHYTLGVPGSPTLDVFCIDFLNAVRVGDQWTAAFSSLSGSLADTRHGDAALPLYQRSAWLVTQFATHAQSEWGAIHAAIWYTMAPNPEAVTAIRQSNWGNWQRGSTTVQQWLTMADHNYGTVNLENFTVITDVAGAGLVTGGKQEYITVSEPWMLLLLATGMLALLGIAVIRRRSDSLLTEGVRQQGPLGLS